MFVASQTVVRRSRFATAALTTGIIAAAADLLAFFFAFVGLGDLEVIAVTLAMVGPVSLVLATGAVRQHLPTSRVALALAVASSIWLLLATVAAFRSGGRPVYRYLEHFGVELQTAVQPEQLGGPCGRERSCGQNIPV